MNIQDKLNFVFQIREINIKNFMLPDKDISIEITVWDLNENSYIVRFDNVNSIKIDPEYYILSERSEMTILDVSTFQLENTNFSISINEGVFEFKCYKIELI